MITPAQLARPQAPATLDQPIEHLVACHRRIEQRLETLERAGAHLETSPAPALEAIRRALEFFGVNGAWHTADEEESVFPRLRAYLEAGELPFLAHLEHDHQEAASLHRRLDEVVAELSGETVPAASAERYRQIVSALAALYRRHIAEEDTVLVQLSAAALPAEDLAAIAAEMRRRRGL